MNMNFFKKVMTFFSIIWNAILWRRTVKDKKSKSTEEGATGNDVSPEAVPLNSEENAFVDVPLNSSAFEEANRFQIDSETNLHDHDPMIVRDVPDINLPVVQPLIDTDVSLVETATVEEPVPTNTSNLVEGCLEYEPIMIMNSSLSSLAGDVSLVETTQVEDPVPKNISAPVETCEEDQPIVNISLSTTTENFSPVDTYVSLLKTTQVEDPVPKITSTLIEGCHEDEYFLNSSLSPIAEDFTKVKSCVSLVETTQVEDPVPKDTSALVEGCQEDEPIVNVSLPPPVEDFTKVDIDVSLVETTQVEDPVPKNTSTLIEGCQEDESIMKSSHSPPAEDFTQVDIDVSLVESIPVDDPVPENKTTLVEGCQEHEPIMHISVSHPAEDSTRVDTGVSLVETIQVKDPVPKIRSTQVEGCLDDEPIMNSSLSATAEGVSFVQTIQVEDPVPKITCTLVERCQEDESFMNSKLSPTAEEFPLVDIDVSLVETIRVEEPLPKITNTLFEECLEDEPIMNSSLSPTAEDFSPADTGGSLVETTQVEVPGSKITGTLIERCQEHESFMNGSLSPTAEDFTKVDTCVFDLVESAPVGDPVPKITGTQIEGCHENESFMNSNLSPTAEDFTKVDIDVSLVKTIQVEDRIPKITSTLLEGCPGSSLSLTAEDFTQVDTYASLIETTQVADPVPKNASTLEGCLEDEPIMNISFSHYAEGNDLTEDDLSLMDKETNALDVSGSADDLCCQNDPIVGTMIIQPCPPDVLFEELKENFDKALVTSSSNEPILQNEVEEAMVDADLPELVQSTLRLLADQLEAESTIIASDERDTPFAQDLEKSYSSNLSLGNEVTEHDLELQPPDHLPSAVESEINNFEEEIQVFQTDENTFENFVSNDGDFVPLADVSIVGINEKIVHLTILHANDEESTKCNKVTDVIDPPAILLSEVSTNITDNFCTDILHNDQKEQVGNSDYFGLLPGVQASISSVKLHENAKFGEPISELLSMAYSTNYMVRSDSLVNFLPDACYQENPESTSIASTTPQFNDDTDWFEEKVGTLPESSCVEDAHLVNSQPVDQSCLEEIMCTSTGILKLSDSGGDIKHSNSIDGPVRLEDDSTPKNKTPEDKEVETPITPSDFLLTGVFRYDRGGVVSDSANPGAGAVGTDMPTKQVPKSDPVNFQGKSHKFDYKGKELGHKLQPKEESNEYSSTKSENDTLENIDELSYDVNINIIQGDNVFQDNDNFLIREEFEIDPVAVLRRLSAQGHDASTGTGTNGNISSLQKSELYLQGSGGTTSLRHSVDNTRSNVNPRLQDHMSMGEFENPIHSSNNFSQSLPNYNFLGQYLPRTTPTDYNSGDNTMSTAPSFGVNNITLEDSIPMVSVGMANYYETSKWQQPISCTEPDGRAAINNYDAGGMRIVSKNESLFYTHLRPENESLDVSEGYISKVSNEFYPFIDSASYVFRIPEEIRKDEYFNPCVGAAPSGRVIPGKTSELLKCEASNMDVFKLDEHSNFMSKRDRSWSQRPTQHDMYPIPEGIEPKFTDGCYRSKIKTPVESEHLQKNASSSCRVWSSSEQLLPAEKTAPFLNGFETNEHYAHALDNVHPHPLDFVPMEYLPNAVYDNNQNSVNNDTNGYEFVNPYGVFPMLNIPFCLPDPSFVPRGPVPPFVFPIVPVSIDQEEGTPMGLEPDTQNSLYPLSPQPYWVGFQADNGSRSQNDIAIRNEMTAVEGNRNYPQLQISINESIGDDDEVTEECPIPDPYFQLAENSSLHSVKSKAESYNGSLFCESLRSILSSHNAESDNVIPSFSCSSVRCYNPSLVVQSCETSLSNDSLPSIIVEGNYSKSIDEDYSAKEKFMNDVNTALNESMMDQSLDEVSDFPAGLVGLGDYEIDMMDTNADDVPEDIERTLQGILEINDTPEFDDLKEQYLGLNNLPEKMMGGHNLEMEGNEEEALDCGNNVNDIIIEILESVMDITLNNENHSTLEESNRDDTWIQSQKAEENIIVQHMFHLEDGFIDEETVELVTDHSIEDEDLTFLGNGMKFGDTNIIADEESYLGDKVLEMPFHGVENGLLVESDVCQNLSGVNAQLEVEEMSLDDADRFAATGAMTERDFALYGKEEEQVSGNDFMPMPASADQNVRRSRRNRRRNRKGAEVSEEIEMVVTEELSIGDGSKQQESTEERSDKPEELGSPPKAINIKYNTIPEALEGPGEEAEANCADEDRCREDQDGDHDGHDGSLGNSSNRKRRNRRKKRKN